MILKQGDRCPLCGALACIMHTPNLGLDRVKCPDCRTFHITFGLEQILNDQSHARQHTPYLSAANRRAAFHGRHLDLNEDNFLRLARVEAGKQKQSGQSTDA
jgi:hypothetical protein